MEKYSLELAGELDSVIIGRPRVERASGDAAYYSGKIMAFRVREIWIQISALSLCNCVTLGKLLHRGLRLLICKAIFTVLALQICYSWILFSNNCLVKRKWKQSKQKLKEQVSEMTVRKITDNTRRLMVGRKLIDFWKLILMNFESLISRDSKDGYYSANDYGSA